ncbi:MAG: sulfotransferase family protein [Limisphaerales bacterium]
MFEEIRATQARLNISPVFVIGIFRSGTSLLYALLNQHPQIALMYECDVLNFPEFFSKVRFKGNWLERQEFYNQALSRHHLIFANCLNGLENIRTPEELYRAYSSGKRAAFFGEKSPPYSPRLRQLARRYPNASFILLERNPVEIYRSMIYAGRRVPFFHQIGINRLIFYKEQMIRQAAELEFSGTKIHHANYNDLVDKTEETCRSVCRFLNIEFDRVMLDLAKADLSAIHNDNHRNHVHEQLQRGVIERRKFSEDGLNSKVIEKLRRFHARWRRLGGGRLHEPISEIEPSFGERIYHGAMGRVLFMADGIKRVLFEFLPLTWLMTYRRTKKWFMHRHASNSGAIAKEFSGHYITILASCLILIVVAAIDIVTTPQLSLMPFYLIPSAMLALIVNRRWGTLAAVASALIWSCARMIEQPDADFHYAHYGLVLWNCAMRFVVLQFVVLLLNRIRLEAASTAD